MSESPQSLHDFGMLGQGVYAHGTRGNYVSGCRCDACRAANAGYEAMRTVARERGEPSGWVSPARARARVAIWLKSGIGVRQAAKLTGVAVRTIRNLRRGTSQAIHVRVEQAILGVEKPYLAKGALVNGYETRHQMEILGKEGYELPKAWLRRHHRFVRVKSALQVKAFYERATAEEPDTNETTGASPCQNSD